MLSLIDTAGGLHELRLGPDLAHGETFQAVVPAGTWVGASVTDRARFALVGCTLAPGFDFADFEVGRRDGLVAAHPRHRAVIERLTR